MKRRKMSHSESRANFKRNATKVHPRNMSGAPMRGGIRL